MKFARGRNQFGGTIGAPVWIPNLYNGKDKTFFFFGYQGTIFHDASASSKAFVPTQEDLNGDFSAMPSASNPANPLGKAIQLYDPATPIDPVIKRHAKFTNNMIPTSRFDSAALNVVKLLPGSGSPNGLTNYIQPNAAQDFHEELIRIDHLLTSKDHLTEVTDYVRRKCKLIWTPHKPCVSRRGRAVSPDLSHHRLSPSG
jgi:hypothetical protein